MKIQGIQPGTEPATTPAEELRAAAAELREKAKPLLGGDLNWADFFTQHGADLGLIREDEDWIALMPPELAEPLAAWLEAEADMWPTSPAHTSTEPVARRRRAALAVARRINRSAP